MLPSASPKPASRRAWGVELGRWLASALLLLGGGLAGGALFLPWWHYANRDGSPLSTVDALTFIPAGDWGQWGELVKSPLGCVAVAGLMGLVTLVLPRRLPDMLELPASLAAIAGLIAIPSAYIYESAGFTPGGMVKVSDSGYHLYGLGCALILVGVWALVIVMRRSRALATHAMETPSPALDHEGV